MHHRKLYQSGQPPSSNRYKVQQFEKVADTLRALTTRVRSVACVENVRGFGKGTLRRIEEILHTGALAEVLDTTVTGNMTMASPSPSPSKKTATAKKKQQHSVSPLATDPDLTARAHLQRVTGIGPRKAETLVAQGATLEKLLELADAGDETGLAPYGLTAHQRMGLRFYRDLQHRIPHGAIARFEQQLSLLLGPQYDIDASATSTMAQCPRPNRGRAAICGSYRRQQPDSGDIDLLLTHASWHSKEACEEGLRAVLQRMRERDILVADLTPEPHTKYMGFVRVPQYGPACRLDIRAVLPHHYVPSALYFTGSQRENIRMRRKAQGMGLKLSEYGIVRTQDATTEAAEASIEIACTSEHAIYDALGEVYRTPSKR